MIVDAPVETGQPQSAPANGSENICFRVTGSGVTERPICSRAKVEGRAPTILGQRSPSMGHRSLRPRIDGARVRPLQRTWLSFSAHTLVLVVRIQRSPQDVHLELAAFGLTVRISIAPWTRGKNAPNRDGVEFRSSWARSSNAAGSGGFDTTEAAAGTRRARTARNAVTPCRAKWRSARVRRFRRSP